MDLNTSDAGEVERIAEVLCGCMCPSERGVWRSLGPVAKQSYINGVTKFQERYAVTPIADYAALVRKAALVDAKDREIEALAKRNSLLEQELSTAMTAALESLSQSAYHEFRSRIKQLEYSHTEKQAG